MASLACPSVIPEIQSPGRPCQREASTTASSSASYVYPGTLELTADSLGLENFLASGNPLLFQYGPYREGPRSGRAQNIKAHIPSGMLSSWNRSAVYRPRTHESPCRHCALCRARRPIFSEKSPPPFGKEFVFSVEALFMLFGKNRPGTVRSLTLAVFVRPSRSFGPSSALPPSQASSDIPVVQLMCRTSRPYSPFFVTLALCAPRQVAES